jgi:glycosyltransferase involved in cell wall biosynthesis
MTLDTTALPKVSVVIRSYKRVHEMVKLVRLLRAQDYPDFEIVVIEQTPNLDPSQAQEIEALRALPEVSIHTYPPLGCAGARTASIPHTQGKVLLFIDDDDLPVGNDWILRHARNFLDPACIGVSGGETGRSSGNPRRDRRLCLTYDFFKLPRQRNGHGTRVSTIQWMPGSNCSLRREVVLAAGAWDEVGLLNHEEHSFYYRLQRRKPRGSYLVFDPEALVQRRFDVAGGAAVRGAPVLQTLLDELRLSHLIIRRQFPVRFALLYPIYLWLACRRTLAFALRTRPKAQTWALWREVLGNLRAGLLEVRRAHARSLQDRPRSAP